MLKPPHPVARMAYALAMFLNPNNHALDGGRATSAMEKESVARIAAMFGWDSHLGHLVRRGDDGEFRGALGRPRAAARARRSRPRRRRITPTRGSRPCWACRSSRSPVDARGSDGCHRPWRTPCEEGEIGTVVVTLGTTAAGTVDPLPGCSSCGDAIDFRIHVDAAYGGYFTLADEPRSRGPRGVRPHRRGRLDRHRSAQARAPAVWLRLRAVSRPGRGAVLQARLALHVFQLGRVAPGRDLARMLAGRRLGGGAVGHDAAAAARAGRRVRRGARDLAARRR